jgi:hypothetical protein
LNIESYRDLLISSTDAFDAVIASLATRAAAIALYSKPPVEILDKAKIEGWIALPSSSIADLL